MQILENISVKPYNTFGIDANTKYFVAASSIAELQESLKWAQGKDLGVIVLGGGSNVLFTKNYDGLIIKNELKGIEKIAEDAEHVYVKVSAGEVWHAFVLYCLQNNLAGAENLALIPGCAGASPMQNIGAYGVEIKDIFQELTALHRNDLITNSFSNSECEFGYRESVFKNKYKNQFVITDVTYKLNKQPHFNIEYGAIMQELEKENIHDLSIQAIAHAVMTIRTSKLPDPKQVGNAGSFFKNPSVTKEFYLQLKEKFQVLNAYENEDGTMKLAAGWMIEQCGFKGFRQGDAGVHEKQALVLVNYGNATGNNVLQICKQVQDAVLEKFGVMLTPEVNII
jgi:UDP-N-acetylmuramate dehydrogenase